MNSYTMLVAAVYRQNYTNLYMKSFISIGTAWSTQYLHFIPTLSCSPDSHDKGSASYTVNVAEYPPSDDEDYGEWVYVSTG